MCTCVGVQDFYAHMKPCWSSLGPVWSISESVSASLTNAWRQSKPASILSMTSLLLCEAFLGLL